MFAALFVIALADPKATAKAGYGLPILPGPAYGPAWSGYDYGYNAPYWTGGIQAPLYNGHWW